MQRPPIISWKHLDPSPAVEAIIRDRIEQLERFDPALVGISIVIEAPTKRKVTGRGVDVRAHLEVPGPDIDAHRSVRQGETADDVILAVNKVFGRLEDVLKERSRVMGGVEVKQHPPVLHGEVVEFEPELGWGFVRADNGREVYFQKDGLVAGDWDAIRLGDRLRFREMEGEKGPFATDVAHLGEA